MRRMSWAPPNRKSAIQGCLKSTCSGITRFSVCLVYEADRIDVTIMSQSYSATNWQQEVCHFQNALNLASYFYPICFKLHQNNFKTRPM